jgi:hypothetical protein
MKLSTANALELQKSLQALDSYGRVIKQGDNEQLVQSSYKFRGVVRRKISKNLAMLKGEIAVYNDASSAKFREISGGRDRLNPEDPGDAKKIAEFTLENEVMLKQEIEVELIKLSEGDLALDDNPIPGTVLAGLEIIME